MLDAPLARRTGRASSARLEVIVAWTIVKALAIGWTVFCVVPLVQTWQVGIGPAFERSTVLGFFALVGSLGVWAVPMAVLALIGLFVRPR